MPWSSPGTVARFALRENAYTAIIRLNSLFLSSSAVDENPNIRRTKQIWGKPIYSAGMIKKFLNKESALIPALTTGGLFLLFGNSWLSDLSNFVRDGILIVWLFCVIVWGAISVVRHADGLAINLGEPYGTLILTFSVASLEIMAVAVVMLTGLENPTLARDTMFSVVMIALNGLIGLGLLLGGWRYREQGYNLRGVNAYLGVIISLAIFGLVVPNFTTSTAGPTFSSHQEGFLIAMCTGLYAVFLAIQTTRHREYFLAPQINGGAGLRAPDRAGDRSYPRSTTYHTGLLLCYLALVIYLVENLAVLLNYGLDVLAAPPALGALLVAVLVLSPEGLGAIQAALQNDLQRTVNILLGSVLATLALTIPSVLIIGLIKGRNVILGLTGVDQVMLLLTLLVSTVTFASGRTNVLQGAVHLMLFLAYFMLIFWK